MRLPTQSRGVTAAPAAAGRAGGLPWTARGAATASASTVDRAVSVGLVLWAVLEATTMASSAPASVRVTFALAATVPLAWRHRAPAAAAIWASLALVVQEGFDVLAPEAVTPYQCLPLATYVLVASTSRPRRANALAVVLCIAYPLFLLAMDEDGSFGVLNAIGVFAVQLTVVSAGLLIRARRLEAVAASDGLRRAELAEATRLAAARQEERGHIAGELGALVARDLASIELRLRLAEARLQAGDAAAVQRECAEVQQTAAYAVGEMRQLLRALRAVDRPAAAAAFPVPAAEDPAVVATAAHAHRQLAADRGQPSQERARRRPRAAASRWLVDAALVALMAGVLVAEARAMPEGRIAAASILAALLVLGPVALRRRQPVAAAAVLAGGFVGRELLGVLAHLPTTLMPSLLIGGYAVGAYASTARRTAVGGAVLLAGGAVVSMLLVGDGGQWADLPVVAFLVGSSLATGQLVRESEGRTRTLRASAMQWAAEHGRRRGAALERERQAVARDLHDVVAHGLSLVGVQAGAAAATAPRDAVAAGTALSVASQAAAQTQQQLRGLAALLAPGDAPLPRSAGDVAGLVQDACATGQQVGLNVRGDLAGLPREAGLAVYRIVQESLTNARKHASGSEVEVCLTVDRATVVVAVRSRGGRPDPDAPGTGSGIAGMRERARLLGGTLTAESAGAAEFLVRAELPLGAGDRPQPQPEGRRRHTLWG